jgi:hypothetical protein
MTVGTFAWLVLQDSKRVLLAGWMIGAIAFLCACSAFSVVLSTHEFHQHKASYDALIQERVEEQLRSTGRVQGRAAEPALRAIREPLPGMVLAAGIERTMPAAWEFTPAGAEELAPYPRSDAWLDDRDVADLPGIIAGLGGLLALWVGVSTMVADRLTGRIAQLRTLPVAPQTLTTIRLAGGAAALTVVTVFWSLTVAVTVRWTGPADMPLTLRMLISMSVPVVLYLALMFGLGTAVGAVARNGLSAYVTTVLLWLASVFVMPPLAQLIAGSLVEVIPRDRMEAGRRDRMADETRLLEQAVGEAMAKQWLDVQTATEEEQRASFFSVGEPVWTAGLSRIRAAARLEERQWLDQRARADRIRSWLDAVNPRTWLGASMAELAGTGHSWAAEWNAAIAAHDRALGDQLFADRPRVTARVAWKDQGLRLAFDRRPAPRYADLQAFVPPTSRAGTWTHAALRNLAGLVVFTALVIAAAYFALLSLFR